ncbi:hypothetical protein [Conexibacter sp. SYSU D00693]|uniref:hypothetical protein n=1 Tax=Conexibacter sp. SYSU D00693 TaxID=2812560 RepID=UPI00196A2C52|nr:hypothetical protein [Conexibacter sp. SYSU D00693]
MQTTKGIAALAATLVLGPASVAHAVTSSQSITADVAPTLQATFPGDYAWGTLAVGAGGNTSSEQTVNVKSNAAWGVKVSSDLADGRMKEWTGAAYVSSSPKVLTHALTWRLSSLGGAAQGTSFAALSSTAAAVTTSQAITGDSGTDVGVTYRQVASFADPSAGGNDYRIAVTYDAAQGY